VILVGGAPSLSSQLRLVPTAICVTFSATASRTIDCAFGRVAPRDSRRRARWLSRGGPARHAVGAVVPPYVQWEQVAPRDTGGSPGRSSGRRFLIQAPSSSNRSAWTR
jgi:hypothetical protein